MSYKQIAPNEISDNFFTRIGEDWLLLCAGNAQDHNAMTCSWGQVGVLWGKPVATVYVRHSRYTLGYMEREDRFTVNFFVPGANRAALGIMGSKSGRDGDKIAEAGLRVREFDGVPGFEDTSMVLVCRKLYKQDMDKDAFLDPGIIQAAYPDGDFHRMYVGAIEAVFVAEGV